MNAQFREGDWNCPACGNHNFASRQQCNKCGAPKTEGSEVGTLALSQPRPSSAAEKNFRPGDWNCLTCGNHNFASRTMCNKCGAPRTDGGGPPAAFAQGPPPSGDTSNFRPGDWNCQKCGNHNFASRQACNKCGAPKTGGGGKGGFGPWGVAVPMAGFGPYQRGGGVMLPANFGAPFGLGGPGGPGGGANMRPGDWICPSCNNHNYANRTECNKCGRPKAAPTNFRSGDWICPKCSNHNFASREACNKCGESKP